MRTSIDRRGFIGSAAVAAVGLPRFVFAEDEASQKIPFSDVTPYTRAAAGRRWFKGNTHLHTIRSDGWSAPIEAAALFKREGYNFICFTDHNVTATDERPPFSPKAGYGAKLTREVVDGFRRDFPNLVLKRDFVKDGKPYFTTPAYDEICKALEEKGRFLVLSGNEATPQPTKGDEVHCNLINFKSPLVPENLGTVPECLDWIVRRKNVVLGAEPDMLFTLNHPLWVSYDISPLYVVSHPSIRFFEVCNTGSPAMFTPPPVKGFTHDKWWDVVNAIRAAKGQPLLYGVGCDDIHVYTEMRKRGWRHAGFIEVLADELSARGLVDAMYRGDFYASTGILLDAVRFDPKARSLTVEVGEEWAKGCAVEFVGTKRGVDTSVQEIVEWDVTSKIGFWLEKKRHFNRHRRVERFSDEIGQVFKEVKNVRTASYALRGDELYVRARVRVRRDVVDRGKRRSIVLMAWTQPVLAG